jgi:hypothetical protein
MKMTIFRVLKMNTFAFDLKDYCKIQGFNNVDNKSKKIVGQQVIVWTGTQKNEQVLK